MTRLTEQRDAARVLGQTRFISDVRCSHGHVGERMTANTSCAVCHRESGRRADAKRVRNPEERSRTCAKHYAATGKARQQAWVRSNLEQANQVKKAWADRNQEKVRTATQKAAKDPIAFAQSIGRLL